jgi:t-SNARE complex subunit (syntaxin)
MAEGELTRVGEAVGGAEQAVKIIPILRKSRRKRFIVHLLAVL